MLCQMRLVTVSIVFWVLMGCVPALVVGGSGESLLWGFVAFMLLAVVPVPKNQTLWVLDRTARAGLYGALISAMAAVTVRIYGYSAVAAGADSHLRQFIVLSLAFWGLAAFVIAIRVAGRHLQPYPVRWHLMSAYLIAAGLGGGFALLSVDGQFELGFTVLQMLGLCVFVFTTPLGGFAAVHPPRAAGVTRFIAMIMALLAILLVMSLALYPG